MLGLNDPMWLLEIIKRYSAALGASRIGTPNIIPNENATGSPEYIVVIKSDEEPKSLRVMLTEEAYQERRYDEFGSNLLKKVAEWRLAQPPKCPNCGMAMKLDMSAAAMPGKTGERRLFNCPGCGTGQYLHSNEPTVS